LDMIPFSSTLIILLVGFFVGIIKSYFFYRVMLFFSSFVLYKYIQWIALFFIVRFCVENGDDLNKRYGEWSAYIV
jgi:hypothetical protein